MVGGIPKIWDTEAVVPLFVLYSVASKVFIPLNPIIVQWEWDLGTEQATAKQQYYDFAKNQLFLLLKGANIIVHLQKIGSDRQMHLKSQSLKWDLFFLSYLYCPLPYLLDIYVPPGLLQHILRSKFIHEQLKTSFLVSPLESSGTIAIWYLGDMKRSTSVESILMQLFFTV